MRLELLRRQVLWLQTPLGSAGPIAATWHQRHWRPPATSATSLLRHEEPTVHVVSQRGLQLRQRVAPGAQLQQPQRHGDTERGRDQVGLVLRLGERLVEADGEAAVELSHAALQAAVTAGPVHQPQADEEPRHRQATHVLSAAGGDASATDGPKNKVLRGNEDTNMSSKKRCTGDVLIQT